MEDEREAYPPARTEAISDRSLLAQVTDPRPIIEEFSHRLRGEVYNSTESKWELPFGMKVKCNELGVSEIINELFPRVCQNTTLTNLTAKEVSDRIICFAQTFMYRLAENMDAWEVTEENLDSIFWMCVDMVFFTLKRGFEQGEKKFLSKVMSQVEQILHNQQKKGLLDGILQRNRND